MNVTVMYNKHILVKINLKKEESLGIAFCLAAPGRGWRRMQGASIREAERAGAEVRCRAGWPVAGARGTSGRQEV